MDAEYLGPSPALRYPDELYARPGLKRTRDDAEQDGLASQNDLTAYGPSKPKAPVLPGQEKEKSRKLSCKECRRLKLKCDRIFPCQSCVKRGCGEICPEGSLTSGRGSRFILANTEQLHAKNNLLCDRIRQLEAALEALHSRFSDQTHPLLIPELMAIKSTHGFSSEPAQFTPHLEAPPKPEMFSPMEDAPEDSPVHLPAKTKPAIPTVGAPSEREEELRKAVQSMSMSQPEYRHQGENPAPEEWKEQFSQNLPTDILQLSATFPFPWAVDVSIRRRIRDALPPIEEAKRICQEAQRNALWQYNLNPSETFIPNLLHYCYHSSLDNLSPRRLALLLMVLSIGSLVDLSQPPGSLLGEAYHHLARASVCEIPLMEEPDFDTLHTLTFMIWWHLIFSDNRKAIGYAWNLLGFTTKLAHAVWSKLLPISYLIPDKLVLSQLGAHRGMTQGKRIPEEDEKQRAVYWELLNIDCKFSLSMGRPPSLHLAHVHCKPPSYIAEGVFVPREEIIYHEWKYSFLIKCLHPSLQAMVDVNPVTYEDILRLDGQMRDFPVPEILNIQNDSAPSERFLRMQRALVSTSRDTALLQLHRRYFTEAVSSRESFHLQHRYAPSVLATFLSCRNMITAVETLYHQEQQLSARFLVFWFNAFSCAVTLSLLVRRLPSTPIAPPALHALEQCCTLFRRTAKILVFTGKSLPIMESLFEKARSSHGTWRLPAPLGRPSAPVILPPPFINVHPVLAQFAEEINWSSSPNSNSSFIAPKFNHPSNISPSTNDDAVDEGLREEGSWLGNIYTFNTLGVGIEERYATEQKGPFVPAPGKFSDRRAFTNLEYGALATDIEDTTYMGWF